MTFVVVGGSGFLGRHLRAEIAHQGFGCVGTRTRPDPAPGLVPFNLATDQKLADALPPGFFAGGPVWVVLCACVTPMDRCRTEWDHAYRVNVTATCRLADEAARLGARVAFVSTSYVFDGRDGYYREDDPTAPGSAYGEHKLAVERHLARHHPDALAVRLDKLVGSDPAERHPFTDWWEAARGGRPVVCIRDQLMSPTDVDDAARGMVLACRLGLRGVYHLTAPEFFPRDHLARHFLRVMGLPDVVVTRPQAEFGFADPRPQNTYLDSSRFVDATGMRFTPLSAVIRRFRDRALAVPRPRHLQPERTPA